MSLERAKAHLEKYHLEHRIQLFDVSSATVGLAAEALGVDEDLIAKTLSFRDGDSAFLIVLSGQARLDNRKFKQRFQMKARMLPAEECEGLIGHAVGGVCPFGVNQGIPVYLDTSLQKHRTVFPATGTAKSAIELTPDELFTVSEAIEWVSVSKDEA